MISNHVDRREGELAQQEHPRELTDIKRGKEGGRTKEKTEEKKEITLITYPKVCFMLRI